MAPGGGPDAALSGDPNCHPNAPGARHRSRSTITASPRTLRHPTFYEGTSMAAPHVAATAALVIASRVLGHSSDAGPNHRTAEGTARALGDSGDERLYGAGLLDAAAATAPGGPGAVAASKARPHGSRRAPARIGSRRAPTRHGSSPAPTRRGVRRSPPRCGSRALRRRRRRRRHPRPRTRPRASAAEPPRVGLCARARARDRQPPNVLTTPASSTPAIYYTPGSLKARLCVAGRPGHV